MKQVWVNDSSWAFAFSTTRGFEFPAVVTAIPAPRSMSWLPSASLRMPPPPATT